MNSAEKVRDDIFLWFSVKFENNREGSLWLIGYSLLLMQLLVVTRLTGKKRGRWVGFGGKPLVDFLILETFFWKRRL
jgi:hypothetical protein